MTPTLSTPRLVLRELTKATGRQVRWLNTPEVVKFSEQRHRTHTLESQEIYVCGHAREKTKSFPSFGFPGYLWGIHDVASDNHIGNISATIDRPNNISEVSILIGETDYWKKGYGKEAWEAVCNWLLAKDGGGVRKLEAGCMTNNIAMVRIIIHSGFVYEGERLNHFLFDGQPVGMKLFGRFR